MKVLAFDANSIVNRAFYGVRLLSTREGTYTNAVYGFFNIVYKLIEEQKPDAVAFAFDSARTHLPAQNVRAVQGHPQGDAGGTAPADAAGEGNAAAFGLSHSRSRGLRGG